MENTSEQVSKCKMKNKNRRNRRKENEQNDLDQGHTKIPEYFVKNGLRFVEKYTYIFRTFAKGRWVGRPLIEVLEDEFKTYNKEYYLEAIEQNKILINEQETTADYLIQLPDQLTHFITREEPPIIDCPLDIISETEDYIILDKPSSIPVHPCGSYKYNTLQLLLERLHGYEDIRICNRLDKQTSGIVFVAKSVKAATEFSADLKSLGEVRKVYYARVTGKVDLEESECEEVGVREDGEEEKGMFPCFTVSKPLYRPKSSYVTTVPPENPNIKPKSAKTRFELLFYDPKSNTSVVKCFPLTGRTHQIRVHLKSIGHPIANDFKYGGVLFNDIPGLDESEEGVEKCENELDSTCVKFWLHAYQYTFKGQVYQTKVPDWAMEEYQIDRKFEDYTPEEDN